MGANEQVYHLATFKLHFDDAVRWITSVDLEYRMIFNSAKYLYIY